MASARKKGVLIVGGGLSGCLAALALVRKRPDINVHVVEEGDTFGGDRVWCFRESDVAPADRWLLAPLVAKSWPGYHVVFPKARRNVAAPFHAIRSDRLDRVMKEALRPDQYTLGTKVIAVRQDAVILQGGDRIRMDGAIDARGPAGLTTLDLGWENFVGREYVLERPHGLDRPVILDATVKQSQGSRYFTCLPFAPDRLLIEERHFMLTPAFDAETAAKRVDGYALARGWKFKEMVRQESGSLPIALDGDFAAFWLLGGAPVAKIGTRAGLFHHVTGQPFCDAVRTALMLTKLTDFRGATLHRLFQDYAGKEWEEREYYRRFNRALYRQLDAPERVSALARIHRFNPRLVARFYCGEATRLDRMRIGLGRR